MSEYIGFKAGREIEWLELNLLKNKKSLSKSTICSLSGEDETIVDEWISILESRINLYKKRSQLFSFHYKLNSGSFFSIDVYINKGWCTY